MLFRSATALHGIEPLLRAIAELLLSPADRGGWTGTSLGDGSEVSVEPTPEAPFTAVVFKTLADRYAGSVSLMRVVSGSAKSDLTVLDASSESRERLGKLLLPQGAEHPEAPEAGPGDVIGVAKLKSVHTGHVLTAEKGGVRLPEIPIPQGVISYAIQAKTKGDEDKVYTSLGRLVEEDPTLQLGREASTGEFLLTGMGELHEIGRAHV